MGDPYNDLVAKVQAEHIATVIDSGQVVCTCSDNLSKGLAAHQIDKILEAQEISNQAIAQSGAPAWIRHTHPYGFRVNQWARIVGVAMVTPSDWEPARPCFHVRFLDGFEDMMPVHDPDDPYEFSATGPMLAVPTTHG